MSTKYSWRWDGDTKWHPTLLAAMNKRKIRDDMPQSSTSLFRSRMYRHVRQVDSIAYCEVSRAFLDFSKCQLGAMAVDMGMPARDTVMRVEQAHELTVEQASWVACNQSSVRLARALVLAAGVGSLSPLKGALLALRLRSRKRGETAPMKLLESFVHAEFPHGQQMIQFL